MKAKGDMWKGKKAWDVSATSKCHIVRKSCHFSLSLFHFASLSYTYAHAHIAFLSWWKWEGEHTEREREREHREGHTDTEKQKKGCIRWSGHETLSTDCLLFLSIHEHFWRCLACYRFTESLQGCWCRSLACHSESTESVNITTHRI